jgi:predicted nucleic acid-binding protein
MTERCFIDSNIWLYAFIQSQSLEKNLKAKALINQSQIVVSVQIVNEVAVNLLRHSVMTEEEIRHLITSFFTRYPVVELTQDILLLASDMRQKHALSYWDSLIVACALSANVNVLYSEDMQDGLVIEGQLTIRNPLL